MATDEEIRDKLAGDLQVVEEGVAAALAFVRHQAIELQRQTNEALRRLKESEEEIKGLDHRLRSIRMGILGLYDKKDAEDAAKRRKG